MFTGFPINVSFLGVWLFRHVSQWRLSLFIQISHLGFGLFSLLQLVSGPIYIYFGFPFRQVSQWVSDLFSQVFHWGFGFLRYVSQLGFSLFRLSTEGLAYSDKFPLKGWPTQTAFLLRVWLFCHVSYCGFGLFRQVPHWGFGYFVMFPTEGLASLDRFPTKGLAYLDRFPSRGLLLKVWPIQTFRAGKLFYVWKLVQWWNCETVYKIDTVNYAGQVTK